MKINQKIIWEFGCNALMALFYIHFMMVFIQSYLETRAPSTLLYALFDTIIVILLLVRRMPSAVTPEMWQWALAFAGTFSTILIRPVETPLEMTPLLVIQLLGILISIAGLVSLWRSFGIVPANRGIRVGGMYRFIRHPLYAGYVFSVGSFITQNFSWWNLGIFIFHVALQICRIYMEEEFLGKDPAYVAYMQKTRWRLVPFIW